VACRLKCELPKSVGEKRCNRAAAPSPWRTASSGVSTRGTPACATSQIPAWKNLTMPRGAMPALRRGRMVGCWQRPPCNFKIAALSLEWLVAFGSFSVSAKYRTRVPCAGYPVPVGFSVNVDAIKTSRLEAAVLRVRRPEPFAPAFSAGF